MAKSKAKSELTTKWRIYRYASFPVLLGPSQLGSILLDDFQNEEKALETRLSVKCDRNVRGLGSAFLY